MLPDLCGNDDHKPAPESFCDSSRGTSAVSDLTGFSPAVHQGLNPSNSQRFSVPNSMHLKLLRKCLRMFAEPVGGEQIQQRNHPGLVMDFFNL